MLRKKEKKAIASIFLLLLGWPLGLDRFFEGDKKKGFIAFIAWPLGFYSLIGLGYLGSEYMIAVFGFLIILGLMFYGLFRVLRKLVIVSRVFVDADD